MARRGRVDGIDEGTISGWAYDDARCASAALEIVVDGSVRARVVPDEFRPDLRAAGIGSGRHAFRWRLPHEALTAGSVVTVRFADDGATLTDGERDARTGLPLDDPAVAALRQRRGVLDSVAHRVLTGWAYDPVTRTSPELEVELDGTVAGRFVPDEPRADLSAAGIGSGAHAFTWTLPDWFSAHRPVRLVVRFAADGVPLEDGVRVVFGSDLFKSDLFGAALAFGDWQPTAYASEGGRVTVEGWGVPPFAAPAPFVVTRNGARPLRFTLRPRPDLVRLLGLPSPYDRFGFRAEFDADDGAEEFAFADARTGEPFYRHHSFHRLRSPAPLPDAANRTRIGGTDDLENFITIGSTSYVRLERVLQEYAGHGFDGARAVLDWGCGCGRVFRYLPPDVRARLTGIDIDADNISWCRANFPAARFSVVEPSPPTALPAAAFDVVFGISVFTHLTERNHLEWLAELARVTAPGGTVLVTIHGETAWLNPGFSMDRYAEWKLRGFLVFGENHHLDAVVGETPFYQDVFITRRYVYERWSPHFDVLDVLPGAIGGNQDLVVLRRPA